MKLKNNENLEQEVVVSKKRENKKKNKLKEALIETGEKIEVVEEKVEAPKVENIDQENKDTKDDEKLDNELALMLPLVEEWKKEHKKVFFNNTMDGFVFWRRIKRSEYKDVLKKSKEQELSLYDIQEEICKVGILYPDNIEELLEYNGGLASMLGDEILAKSGMSISITTEF